MPDVQHNSLGGAELHEPKGVASATSGQVYIANGAGSGAWAAPVVDPSDGTAGEVPVANGSGDVAWVPREYHLTGLIANVSTAEVVRIPIPYAGTVVKIVTVLGAAISGANANVLLKNAAAATMGGVTVAFTGSAAGDVDFDDTLANNAVTTNSLVSVETDGGSTDAAQLWFTITVERNS